MDAAMEAEKKGTPSLQGTLTTGTGTHRKDDTSEMPSGGKYPYG